ncbi:M20/M25/M40 family metallo-hydrolase [Caminibacter sp.]
MENGKLKKVLNIFKKITKIPHCSGNTEELKNFIIDWCKNFGYEVQVDEAGNILATCENPKLSLQSHYDMVCVGNAPEIEIIQKDGWLIAESSSLGADNGIGVAIMLYFASLKKPIEFLFTNDEEIGLIGAFNLELKIKSKYLLNLDSEDENIYIGSAGGVDVKIRYPESTKTVYGTKGELKVENLPGGHSGVDIDKNIPNAIVELLKRVKNTAYLKGGERSNSIPVNAKSVEIFEGSEEFEVYDDKYLHFLKELPHGVLEFDFKYTVPSKSVNFALIDGFEAVLSCRANSNEKLEEIKNYILSKTKGAKVEFEGEYPAWAPEENTLVKKLQKITGKELKVIHAGLECGILKNKLNVEVASFGPIIENPHSIRERVNIESVKRVIIWLDELIKEI